MSKLGGCRSGLMEEEDRWMEKPFMVVFLENTTYNDHHFSAFMDADCGLLGARSSNESFSCVLQMVGCMDAYNGYALLVIGKVHHFHTVASIYRI